MTWSGNPAKQVTTCTPLDTRGPKRLWDAPAGCVSRARGDVGRLVKHDYVCPVHGRFELEVPSGDVPDVVPCPTEQDVDLVNCSAAEAYEAINQLGVCGLASPWSPGAVNIWASSGEVTS